jgi:hypothetical protein
MPPKDRAVHSVEHWCRLFRDDPELADQVEAILDALEAIAGTTDAELSPQAHIVRAALQRFRNSR